MQDSYPEAYTCAKLVVEQKQGQTMVKNLLAYSKKLK